MNKKCGFHLVELLLTVSIMAILSLIAIPCYRHYLTYANRLEAQTVLGKVALALEYYYLEHHSYQEAVLEVLAFSNKIANGNYRLAILSATENAYLLAAIPLQAQMENDKECGTLTLNSSGDRLSTGNNTHCW